MNKKLILCLLVILSLAVSAASAATYTYMKVIVQDARVRKGPGDSDIITSLDKGTKVLSTGMANKSYYKIKLSSGKTGYIFRDHVKKIASADASKVYQTTARVNLRRNPRVGSTLVKTLKKGAYVKVLSTAGGWTRVKTTDGKKGYVKSSLLKKVK